MKLFYKLLFTFSLPFFSQLSAQNQDIWADVDMGQVAPGRVLDMDVTINNYRTLSLDLSVLRNELRNAPLEFTTEGTNAPLMVDFPMPNGTMETFRIVESPIMEDGLAAKYPSIKTFAGRSLSNPANRIRFDYNNENFNAIILTTEGTTLITPFAEDLDEYYISFKMDEVSLEGHDHEGFKCELHDGAPLSPATLAAEFVVDPSNTRDLGLVDLQTYRYAVATTGEYSNGPGGGTVNSVMNNIVTITNQLNGVFEVEAAIRFIMVDNNDELYFFDQFNDPYANGDLPTMITQNQLEINNTIGAENYDLGHVYGTNSGGLASLASVCNDNQKARAGSAPFGTSSGPFFFLTIAHEIGHQFNATHTFNLCDGDNETASTGFENGAGITIMSYSGASNCGSQWIALISDNYFHINSLERMRTFSRDENSGGSCDVAITVENNMPDAAILMEEDLYIPISTPFVLTGEGSDPDGDDITFCWEQYDLGDPSPLGNPMGTAPLFRSYPPTDTPVRILPRLVDLVDNIDNPHEVLPSITRPITFRMTVRDNNEEAGAHSFEQIAFESTATAGPFVVTAPNDGTETWEVGDYVEIAWDVANTDNDLVNCQNVDITLSMDGGFTYPISLCAGTANDGSAFVNVPDAVTSEARIRVAAADNIFFDISNEDFAIVPASTPGFTFSTEPHVVPIVCLPEVVEITIATSDLLDFDNEIALSIESGLPTGAVATFSPETVLPGVQSVLTIDLSNVTEEGIFAVNVQGDADGADTEIRTIDLELVYTDFSALEALTPNTEGVSVLPTFTWTDIAHADNYELQVATNPTFDNIIFSYTGDLNSIVSEATLEVATQYFWRVRAINECGAFDFTAPAAFFTEALVCNEVTSEDTPIVIPAAGLTTTPSVINIADSGTIVDLNITKIEGNHNGFNDIIFVLTAPDGTTVEFLSENSGCNSSSSFSFGLDDESDNGTDYPCPPVGGLSYAPVGPGLLSDFDGLEVNGDWTLAVQVVSDFFQEAGNFGCWALEYCGSFPAASPFIVTNDLTCVTPLGTRAISETWLDIDDTDNLSGELMYTLLTVPENGVLTLNGTPLAVGDNFTQFDVFDYNVYYENTNADVAGDDFSFTIVDGNGGFLGATTFAIEILDEADCMTTNTTNLNVETDVDLYPNPAKEMVFVEFKQPVSGKMIANVVDVQGRTLATHNFENVDGKIEINTANLATGVYFINFQTENTAFTKKVTIE